MPESWYPSVSRSVTPRILLACRSSASLSSATACASWPSSPGLTPPGASPNSPFVQVTTTVRMPWPEYVASTPPVLDDSSSGCACTAISVSLSAMPQACLIGGPPGYAGQLCDQCLPFQCRISTPSVSEFCTQFAVQ